MKKMSVFIYCLVWSFALIGQMSTHVPIEAYRPPKPDQPGYIEHTFGIRSYLYARPREGIARLEAAAQKGYVPASRKLGDIYLHKRGFRERAEEYYLQAANQGDTLAIQALAEIYLEENNLPLALEYYQKLVPTHPSVWLTISRIYRQMGETKKAAEAFNTFQEVHKHYHWHR